MFWLWPHAQGKILPRTRYTNVLNVKRTSIIRVITAPMPESSPRDWLWFSCPQTVVFCNTRKNFSTEKNFSSAEASWKGYIFPCQTWCLSESPIICKRLYLLVDDAQAERAMGMCTPQLWQASHLWPWSSGARKPAWSHPVRTTGMHFCSGKWQGLKFSIN